MDVFGYCTALEMLDVQRMQLAPCYTTYVRWILSKKHYGKTRKRKTR